MNIGVGLKCKYLDILSGDHCVTVKEDYFAFLKQEGILIVVLYTICLSLQVFVFRFAKGYLQAFFALLAPIGVELHPIANWILSFVLFVIGYQVVAILYRRHIRKEKYDYLFERHKKYEWKNPCFR